MKLQEPDGGYIEITQDMQRLVKALAADPAHAEAVHFIIYTLCGRQRASFVAGLANQFETMAWLEGRRYVGETLGRLIERPIEDEPGPAPPARNLGPTRRTRFPKPKG